MLVSCLRKLHPHVYPFLATKPHTQTRTVVVRVNALTQRAEYIWYDGNEGKPEKGVMFNEMRSKTKCIPKPITSMNPGDFPSWSFDGSSTGQAEGNNSGSCLI